MPKFCKFRERGVSPAVDCVDSSLNRGSLVFPSLPLMRKVSAAFAADGEIVSHDKYISFVGNYRLPDTIRKTGERVYIYAYAKSGNQGSKACEGTIL